jgi:hypothetical protein
VSRDVDSNFCERFDRKRIHVPGWAAAGARDLKAVFGGRAENALRHVAAAGIPGAKDKNKRRVSHVG